MIVKLLMTEAADQTSFGVSKLKRRLQRIVLVYLCQSAALLEITCHGSFMVVYFLSCNHLSEEGNAGCFTLITFLLIICVCLCAYFLMYLPNST